jgi:hypothetical protein
MNSPQIDNSNLMVKKLLRIEYVRGAESATILDCFHGHGILWDSVKKSVKKSLLIVGIEKQYKKGDNNFYADNRKILSILDLGRYNVIDLDSYGIPFAQLFMIFKNKTLRSGTAVFYTFIQSVMGIMNISLLEKIGYSRSMIRKCPTLFSKNGFDKFTRYLFLNGVRKIVDYDCGNKKHYGFFIVEKSL